MLETAGDVQVTEFLDSFGVALEGGDVEAAVALFQPDGYWRDLVSFTWNIKTMEGADQVREMLVNQLPWIRPTGWRLAGGEEVTVEDDGTICAWVSFETAEGRGYGHLRLRDGRIWTLLTTMVELKGYKEPVDGNRPLGAKHGVDRHQLTWTETLEKEQAELGYGVQPYTVIIGGGQGGIALGARLRQLDVPTIIVEKNERPGDSWRNRYKSLCLHDPVWYDHLPYVQFPRNWPVYAPKDKIGDWLEMYTRIMELNYWTRSTVERAEFDGAAKEWTVTVDRDGEQVVLRPKQLVFATGMAGKPNIPDFPGMETFKGDQHHSSQHPGPDAFAGKKVAVVGSNNSAHDICAALWEHDVDVTMVQRSSTHVVRSEPLFDFGMRDLYSEEAMARGITTEKADLIFASVPYAIAHEAQIPMYDKIRAEDAEFYSELEKAGFQLDFGADESGLMMKYLRRGSGYYIDVGASQLVIDGKIKLKSGQVTEIVEDGLVMDDGSKLEADVIVYATGYGSMNGWVADLIDRETADRVGKVWGLGSDTPKDPGPWEGELRNMWKPTQQEALWFQGGNLHQSRHYSQFLALQLKARMEGIETPVYGLQESHHTGRPAEEEVPKPARLEQDADLLAQS